MGLIHGKGGSITWGGTAGFADEGSVTSWSANYTISTEEFTSMATTHKVFKAGFLDWTATVEVIWDGTANLIADVGNDNSAAYFDLELEMIDAGVSVHGSAIALGVTATVDMEDVVRLTYAFQGTGVLAFSA